MNAMGIIALLALVACANAGYLEHPVFHSHGPVVKHIHPDIYAVPPPILAKPVVYSHAPVVKVFHAPAPIVKTLSIGPLGYGAYDHHHHHGYHHGPAYHGHGYHHGHAYHGHGHAYHGHPFLF